MKKVIIIFVFLIFILPCQAETILTGGVNYDVNSARDELLQNYKKPVSRELLKLYAYDYKNKENLTYLLKGLTDLKDRTLAYFSDNTYAVMYFEDKLHVFYYKYDGSLLYIEEKASNHYPYKSYKYDVTGKLVNMSLRVSKGETFIYTPGGKLIAHWINSNGYDERGNIIMTRKYAE